MSFVVVTDEVFQLPMGWLNFLQSLKRLFILVTLEVSQLPMGWLNEVLYVASM